MNEVVPPPGNLEDWSTNRLKLLLQEYTDALSGLYARDSGDTQTYELWIRALERELDKREQGHQTL